MDAVDKFLAMGGYAVYVWPAFALTAVVMVGLVLTSLRSLKRERRTLAALEAARPRRARDLPPESAASSREAAREA